MEFVIYNGVSNNGNKNVEIEETESYVKSMIYF